MIIECQIFSMLSFQVETNAAKKTKIFLLDICLKMKFIVFQFLAVFINVALNDISRNEITLSSFSIIKTNLIYFVNKRENVFFVQT